MTILLRDGFDIYSGFNVVAPGMLGRGWVFAGLIVNSSSLIAGRFGGQAVRTIPGGAGPPEMRKALSATTNTFSIGFAAKFASLPASTAGTFVRVLTATPAYQCGLTLNPDGSISLVRQSAANTLVVLGTSAPGVVTAGNYHYIEWEGFLNDTTGYGRVFLDGNPTAVLNASNVDTMNVTGAPAASIGLSWSTNNVQIDFDDLYVTDGATRLGPQTITTLTVNGDGGTLNLTPSTGSSHFAVVDEVIPAVADYLSGTTVGHLDELTLADISSNPALISEVNLIAFAAKTDASARAIKIGLKSGATTSDSTDQFLTSTPAFYEKPYALDPNGSIAWLKTAVNALSTRVQVSV